MVATIRGSFNVFEGAGYFDIERPESSSVEVTIDASSVDSRHAERDTHLRSADFLDVASHPAITFVAVSIDQVGVRTYRVAGDLTIKGVTKPVVLEVERTGWMVDREGHRRIGFEGRGVINRKDWGIGWNELLDVGGVLVSDHVTVEFEVAATTATLVPGCHTREVSSREVPGAGIVRTGLASDLELASLGEAVEEEVEVEKAGVGLPRA
jgi:polyisoprenoid-binding protein YceI